MLLVGIIALVTLLSVTRLRLSLRLRDGGGSSAKVVLSSVTDVGSRITTFLLKHQRFILAELNTHRELARNSASSRAIPTKRMLRLVVTDPAMPVRWGRYGKGMQDAGELGPIRAWFCRQVWLSARWAAVMTCLLLHALRLHKQLANRVLEPWLWHQTLVTTTNVWNVFHLRCHPAAQPEFQDLAYKMLAAYIDTEPQLLKDGQWHLPFITERDVYHVMSNHHTRGLEVESPRWPEWPEHRWGAGGQTLVRSSNQPTASETWEKLCLMSAARCCRVSYMRAEDSTDVDADLKTAKGLTANGHWSPLEHQARPGIIHCKSGNFTGWIQLRKTFPTEYVVGPTSELALRVAKHLGEDYGTKVLECVHSYEKVSP